MMKKNSIQIKIGLLMLLAVALLSATGYLSYRNLSSIVSSINVDENPELKLIRVREISMDLEKAQNSIRIYTLTNDTVDLKPYYSVITNIDTLLNRLRSECKNDILLQQQTDTISKLIEENIDIWNKIIYLNSNQKMADYLKQLADELDSADNARNMQGGILKRIFSRGKKNRLDEKELISNLQEIEQEDKKMKENLITGESQLASTGFEIKEQFYDLIAKIEDEISGQINAKSVAAHKLADKTYIWLAMFSVSGTLLTILVMFFIIRFVRKTQDYQNALQNSKDEAEKLSRTRELFIANISHEIRTPVTAISGFTEQLLHQKYDESTVRTLKVIKSSSDHLINIIQDVLDFSKLQDENMVLEQTNYSIRQILEDVYALFEKQASRDNNKLGYSIGTDTPPILLGDPYRLKQIIINLVSNSVKFTKDGTIHFAVKCINRHSQKIDLVIECVDTGIGIDENKINFIFEDFTQAEMSTTRKYGGTGLGLSIVKKLVELHNGTIDIKSSKNQGTRISCHLPYLAGEQKDVEIDMDEPLLIPEAIRDLKILIVDDEEYNRLLFKTIFDRWKIEYSEASSGMDALGMLKTAHYNLMFMDIRMPGMDGLRTTRVIREEMNIGKPEMPVICTSAAPVTEHWQEYRNAGMNAFLSKPFTEEKLLTVILSVMKGYSPAGDNHNVIKRQNISSLSEKIKLHNLYHISGGDEKFVKQMLVSFIDTTRKGLNKMQNAALSGESGSVVELAHKLIPPCRHIGASDLCNLLRKIEKSNRSEWDTGLVEKLTIQSLSEFNAVQKLIRDQINNIT